MGISKMVDDAVTAFSLLSKRSLTSYCALDGVNDDSTLVAKDGSVCTLIRVEGAKHVLGNDEMGDLVNRLTTQLSPFLDASGHAMQVWFARDPDASDQVVSALTRAPRNVASRVGLDLDDLFEERERNLPRFVVWEGLYIALWTRLSVLSKDEMKVVNEEQKGMTGKLPIAPNAQGFLRVSRQIMDRHNSYTASVAGSLKDLGIRCNIMDHTSALRAIRASVYPDLLDTEWRPYLPGDKRPAMERRGDNDMSHLLPPKLDEQILDREAEVLSPRHVRVGAYDFAPVHMTIGPSELTSFMGFIKKILSLGEVPWRVSFLIEGNGLANTGIKKLLASILGWSNSANRQIMDSIKALQHQKEREGIVVPRLRVAFATWAPAGEARLLEERASKLQRAIEGWGYCGTSQLAGDPVAGVFSSALAFDTTSTAPAGAPRLDDLTYMLPWNRDASPWNEGAVLFRTPDGRPWPYQPASSKQNSFINLVFAPPGFGKSVFMNSVGLSLCLSAAATQGRGGAQLPRMAIIDIGPSSSGLISLLKEALPPNRQHEVQYRRLEMIKDHAINPFDTQLGCRKPFPMERSFLVNFLTLLGTPVGQDTPSGLSDLAGMAVDEIYRALSDHERKGNPKPYQAGVDKQVDDKIEEFQIDTTDISWWELVDTLFEQGDYHSAMLAQRYAVPRIEDVGVIVRQSQITDAFGEAKTQNGEPLLSVFERMVTVALRDYPILTQATKFDIGDARVVSLDLDAAAPQGGGPADKQTSLVYMLARFVLARDFYLTPDIIDHIPEIYRKFHTSRIQRLRETPKSLVYDEFHRTKSSPSVRDQVVIDMREGRKWGVQISLVSQLLADFSEQMTDMATGVWIMGVRTARAADECQRLFGVSRTGSEIIRTRLNGPGRGGAPFLAVLSMKEGSHEHMLYNTLGPTEIWAFSTTPQDASLRNALYHAIGPQEARRRLAKRFPNGSAVPEIERRIAQMAEQAGDVDEVQEGVIDEIVNEIAQNR